MTFFNVVEIGQMMISTALVVVFLSRMGMVWKSNRLPRVIDIKTNKGIKGATVYFNSDRLKTNLWGEINYRVDNLRLKNKINVLAMDYFSKEVKLSKQDIEQGNIAIGLIKMRYEDLFGEWFGLVGGVISMVLLICQVFFIYTLPPMTVWPFLLLSLLNVILLTVLVRNWSE